MAKKEITYQGLVDLNVQVEDISLSSPDYFRVSKLPSEFTAGKNVFRFKGNASLFAEGAPIYIEILDANGDPIYYETSLDLESAEQAAIVTTYVNEDTATGVAIIAICSTANYDIAGKILDTTQINVRWTSQIYIEPSKRNTDEIIFDTLPEITVIPGTGAYTNYIYSGGSRFDSDVYDYLDYYYYNNTAVLTTSSFSSMGFRTDALDQNSYTVIAAADLNLVTIKPLGVDVDTTDSNTINITSFDGAGIAYLDVPLQFKINDSNAIFQPSYARITNATIAFEVATSGSAQTTENTNNLVSVYFSNLQPQVGTVSKIRSYYRSAGIGEYILSNETDISDQEGEFGFNANVVTASFFLPTTQRNDKLDFKFEFVNPSGYVSKQVVESLNNTFLGGNTYIGGDDNLLTGSLYVAGSTGTGVHISGKGQSAMIRSIGYTGFQNAIAAGGKGGFVMYSGSVQPILGSAESYSGVGLELVANSASYFKYTTSGSGMLDVRTNAFFLGNTSGTFISGSNGNLQISASNFSILNGNVTASNMLLQNISYADFFANKQIVITNENSESFYRYTIPLNNYGKAYCVLDLSGVQGPFASGSAAMYVRFYVNPRLPIAAIISPADSGYDGQIIIETYGPAYSPPTLGTTCGDFVTFGSNVLFQSNVVNAGTYYNSGSYNFCTNIGINSTYYLFPSIGFDKYWESTGSVANNNYFMDNTPITAPAGLPTVNTIGKKRSLRSRITFETDDWSSLSYTQIRVNPANQLGGCGAPYENMLSCAAGGRYAFAPGDSGWRLQSVTNYGGSVSPWFATSLTVSQSLQAGTVGSDWTGVSFGTNWSDYGSGYQTAQYKKFGDQVYLRGLATSGANSWTTYPTIFTLPVDYRPPARLIFAQTVNNNTVGRVDITSSGLVQWVASGAGSGYISLDGISFSTIS